MESSPVIWKPSWPDSENAVVPSLLVEAKCPQNSVWVQAGLLCTVKAYRNARAYELQYTASVPERNGSGSSWQKANGFTSSRSMPINGLTPSTTYTVQACALGNLQRLYPLE
jgi:hypothetical protein